MERFLINDEVTTYYLFAEVTSSSASYYGGIKVIPMVPNPHSISLPGKVKSSEIWLLNFF